MRLTYRFRLRDKHAASLNRQARAVNYVWNYCNETQQKAAETGRAWLSAYDLMKLTTGSSKELKIHAQTIQGVCKRYVSSRIQHRRAWLRFRGHKSLGWVPFSTGNVSVVGKAIKFWGKLYEPMHWREFPAGAKIGEGSFSQDAKGHWYVNVPFTIDCEEQAASPAVGIDLGLKELATLSTGDKIDAPRLYRASETTLATMQRARKSKRVRNIHAKIANRRKDHLHKASAKIAKEFGLIVVGDVSAKQLAQTKLAKSIHDASWHSFKSMLAYKAIRHGGRMIEVDERFTSQTCSECGSLPPQRPRGIAGLGIREWSCGDCETVHDRDVNAARNILRVGLDTLAEGASRKRSSQRLGCLGSKHTIHTIAGGI